MGLSLNAFAQDVEDLVYMTEDYPPLNYMEDGEIKGLTVDLLKLMWKEMGYPEQKIKLLPWPRGYNLIQSNKNHVLFSMVRTKEREPLFKWVGPISKSEYALVSLKKSKIKISSFEDAKKYSIGVIRDDASEQILKSAGLSRLMTVNSLKQNIKKAKNGRIDLFIYDKKNVFDEIKKIYDPEEFEIVFVMNTESDYYAFHKDTPDSLIRKFQEALDNISDKHQAILKKYGWY